jgi:bla regulator protein BlaR1
MIAPFALSLLFKATVILALALAASHLTRGGRAAVRHLVLVAGFVVLALLPFVTVLAPAIRVAVPMASPSHVVTTILNPAAEVTSADTSTETADSSGLSHPSSRRPSMSAVLVGLYLLGVAAVLLPLLLALRRTRAVRRMALPWMAGQRTADAIGCPMGFRRTRVDVLLHESVAGPMTCGIFRPAIVLPTEVRSWAPDELRRAIVHELEHVRRADWITQCLARIVCAAYWPHPAAWLAWREVCLQAERACDDAVLRASDGRAEATDYADQLVVLAERIATMAKPQLAMANRHDLAARVHALLDGRQRRGPAGGRWIAFACGITALLVTAVSPVRLVAVADTRQSAPPARFDAATIKPCSQEEAPPGPARGAMGGTNASFSPGRMNVPCVTLEQLVYLAYAGGGAPLDKQLEGVIPGGASDDKKVRGGPAWVHSQHTKFAVEATAGGASDRYVLVGTMLQSLLEDRFKLRVHRETEDVPMYAMTVAKGGLKLKPMQPGDCVPFDAATFNPDASKPTCGSLTMGGNGPNVVWKFSDFELRSLAYRVSSALEAFVIDRTGVTDKFMLRLEFYPDESTPGIHWTAREGDASAPQAASIFTALEQQVGVKLEKTRGARGYLVIDHVEPLGAGR